MHASECLLLFEVTKNLGNLYNGLKMLFCKRIVGKIRHFARTEGYNL